MIGEQRDEPLTDHPGGAEYANFQFFRHGGESSKTRGQCRGSRRRVRLRLAASFRPRSPRGHCARTVDAGVGQGTTSQQSAHRLDEAENPAGRTPSKREQGDAERGNRDPGSGGGREIQRNEADDSAYEVLQETLTSKHVDLHEGSTQTNHLETEDANVESSRNASARESNISKRLRSENYLAKREMCEWHAADNATDEPLERAWIRRDDERRAAMTSDGVPDTLAFRSEFARPNPSWLGISAKFAVHWAKRFPLWQARGKRLVFP